MKQLLYFSVVALLLNYAVGTVCNCPQKCTCTSIGTAGITAECSTLSLTEQTFCDSVQHVKVSNAENEIALGPNFFKELGLEKVESIKIVNSSLSTIDVKAFSGLHNLYHLNLSDNGLILIHPDTFASNINLNSLILDGNPLQLTQVLEPSRKYLLKSKSLVELKLSRCQLRSLLPDTFSELKNLMVLDLSSNLLSQVTSDTFKDVPYLEELNLSHNLIREINPETFSRLASLMQLLLKNNSLSSFDKVFLNYLEVLDLSHNKLKNITGSTFSEAKSLEKLDISGNNIAEVSFDAFIELKSLCHLDISRNNFSKPLHPTLFTFNNKLETLNMAGNHFGKVLADDFLKSFGALLKLDLSHCKLHSISEKALKNVSNLSNLNLSHNFLTFSSFAERSSIANLKSLRVLDLSYNKIEEISNHLFDNVTQLNTLYLGGNPITSLPVTAFSPLTHLNRLDVSNCRLVSIWNKNLSQNRSIKLLPQLTYLNISNNELQYLHVHDFKHLISLKTVELSGNPLKCVTPFTNLVHYFIVKRIAPSQYPLESLEYLSEDIKVGVRKTLEWKPIVQEVCNMYENDVLMPKEKVAEKVSEMKMKKEEKKESDLAQVLSDAQPPSVPMSVIQVESELSYATMDDIDSFSDRIDYEDSIYRNRVLWQMIVLTVTVLSSMFLGFLWAFQKRRKMAVQKAFFGSQGGHIIKTKSGGGSLYYKLYEECSVPNQPTVRSSGFQFSKFQIPSLVSDYKKIKISKSVDEV